MGKRMLFSEICPLTYKISMEKEIFKRKVQDALVKTKFAKQKATEDLEYSLIKHNSLRCTKKKGYLEWVTITGAKPTKGIGGGMCQFTNLLHWMVVHTNLDIIEHHHHNHIDLFSDFNRKIPFGTGTSIVYNYLDYRVKNNTDITFEIIVYTTEEYLKGEIRIDKKHL